MPRLHGDGCKIKSQAKSSLFNLLAGHLIPLFTIRAGTKDTFKPVSSGLVDIGHSQLRSNIEHGRKGAG
ncbi:hypothetical protein SXCC_02860 [Gluconacetobacter sp. SXCC-1]|nr:hypothetical protein SXCC_02860 [Gluconacetobacter sp. SXCC-1]